MRWGLRYQLLVPPAVLLLGVAGTTAWTATSAATRAREQLDARMRDVTLSLSKAPQLGLSQRVLRQMSLLSGQQFILIDDEGSSLKTLPSFPEGLPSPVTRFDDLQTLRLEAHVWVDGERYLCSGVRLRQGTLYVLYSEALWRNALWEAVRPSLILGGVL